MRWLFTTSIFVLFVFCSQLGSFAFGDDNKKEKQDQSCSSSLEIDPTHMMDILDKLVTKVSAPRGTRIIEHSSIGRIRSTERREFVQSLEQYLLDHAEENGEWVRTENYQSIAIRILVDRNNKILGGYIYLVQEFMQSGHSDMKSEYWMNGYFDSEGNFLGRGNGYEPYLSWSHY